MAIGPTLTIQIEGADADGPSAFERRFEEQRRQADALGGTVPGSPVGRASPGASPALARAEGGSGTYGVMAPAARPGEAALQHVETYGVQTTVLRPEDAERQAKLIAEATAKAIAEEGRKKESAARDAAYTYAALPPPDRPGDTYGVRPAPALPGEGPRPKPNAGATVVLPELVNESIERTAETIKHFRLANDELRASLADGSYLKQTRELVQLRRDEAALMKDAGRAQARAQYGAPGAAGREALGAAAGAFGWLNRQEQTAGQVGVQAVQNNGLGAVVTAATAAASGLTQLGRVGGAAGAALQAAASAAGAFGQFVTATVERGRQLSFASAQLAGATAAADVRSYQADIREANYLGGVMADMVREQSELGREFREVMLPIKKVAMEAGTGLLMMTRDFLQGALAFMKDSSWMPDAFRDYAKRVLAAIERPQATAEDLLNDFRNAFDVPLDGWEAAPRPANPRGLFGDLNLPLIR